MNFRAALVVAALTASASLGIYIQQGLSDRVASALALSGSAMTLTAVLASVAIAAGYVIGPVAAAQARSTKRFLIVSLCALAFTAGPLLELSQESPPTFVFGRILMSFSSGAALALASQFGLSLVGDGNQRSAVLATMVGVLVAFVLLIPASVLVAERHGWIWSYRILAVLTTSTLVAVALIEAPQSRPPLTASPLATPSAAVWRHIKSNALVFAAAFTIVAELDHFVSAIGLPSSMVFSSSLSIGAGCAGGLLLAVSLTRFQHRPSSVVVALLVGFATSLAFLAGLTFVQDPPATVIFLTLGMMAALFFALSIELQAEIARHSQMPGVALGLNSAIGFLGQGVGAGIGAASRAVPSGGFATALAATVIAAVAVVHANRLTSGQPR